MADCEVNNKWNLNKLQNICRLCSSEIDLQSIFKFPRPFQFILETVTDIKISRDDKISQNICTKCAASSMNMFQFRDKSRRNNELLRKRYEELLKTKEIRKSHSAPLNLVVDKNTELKVLDKKSTKIKGNTFTKPSKEVSVGQLEPSNENSRFNISKTFKCYAKLPHKIHPSITTLFKEYPNVSVPSCLTMSNISPLVVLKMNEVENHFINQKLDVYKPVSLKLDQPRNVKHTLSNKFTESQKSIQLRNLNNLNINYLAKTQNEKGYDGNCNDTNCNSNDDKDADDTMISVQRKQLSKRRLPVESESSEQCVKKKCLDKSLWRPSLVDSSDKISNLSVTSSQALHSCSICDSHVRYLKSHVNKHLRCQFCKKTFKHFEVKKKHVEFQCRIQKIMESMSALPEIPLMKIELNETVVQQYFKTFSEFGLVSKIKRIEFQTKIQSDKKENTTNDIYFKMNENSFVEADVKIKGGTINYTPLNNGTDIEIIKNLLEQFHKKENSSQTLLPTNESIKVGPSDSTIVMKALKEHLLYYKIPIHVTSGSTINVCYSSSESSNKTSKDNIGIIFL